MTSDTDRFPIVGVGASAGGVEALEGFFKGLPADPGFATVVVTHLNPERESLLHEIIRRQTSMAVSVAVDAEKVAPNHVYVLPADAVLSIKSGRLQIRRLERGQRERKPIDIFFGALAVDQGQWAAAVVLSGGDGDGTLGVKAVKQAGGLTLAQVSDGYGPAHPDMPDSAISTGLVDFAVPVEEMGEKLCDFAQELKVLRQETEVELDGVRPEICALLREQTGHDFSGYKAATFLRRIQRRMAVTKVDAPAQYVERLRRDPKEVAALFRDLLIKVTTFFRDPEAFEALQELAIPKLFEGKGPQDVIRVWVPGCSTGEEAYSIAILLREEANKLKSAPRIQVFATDVDEQALSVARAGRYPEALLDGVTPERKKRFFVSDSGSYTVAKAVREMCIFSPHNVAADPPFSHIDLVSCRNLLIYFGSILQKQVIPNFHYSLWPHGHLFLGMSESAREFGDLFAPVDKHHRIFRCREAAAPRVRMPSTRRGSASIAPLEQLRLSRDVAGASALRHHVEQQVLARHAPAFVVVTRDGEAVHYSGGVGRYLEPPPGAPSQQIMAMARKGLRLELRDAFRLAVQSDRPVTRNVAWDGADGSAQNLSLTVERVSDREGEALYLVLFEPEAPSAGGPRRSRGAAANDGARAERDLQEARERLHSTIEEYETALEELKSSNEELVSLNEELQSTNEELEATKEETQSLNEELQTVNADLTRKIDSLDRANSDLQNLFDSTDVALVFLDRRLTIRSFTPAATRVFNILPSDKGRPITDLSASAALPKLAEDVPQVFTSGKMIERRVEQIGGQAHFLVRLAPYRDAHGQIDGVVISIVDVSGLARAEAHQRVLAAELQHRVRNILGTLRSLARRTLNGAGSVEEAESHLIGRIDTLARVQNLLTHHTSALDLETLLREELLAHAVDEQRVSISGPRLELSPQLVELLTLVFHELATNAVKYGAIGQAGGRIAVSWSAHERPEGATWIDLTWQETGVQVAGLAPVREGFGTELITRRVPYELDGRASLEVRPGGLRAHLEFPLTPGESLLSTAAPILPSGR